MLGPNSLFGMLATVRTAWGEDALLDLLLRETTANVIQARQEAVQELAPKINLREQVALLGSAELGIAPVGDLEAWLERDNASFPKWLRPVLLLTTLSWIAVLVIGLLADWPGGLLLRNLLLIFAVQMLVSWRFRPEVLRELETAKRLGAGIGVLREGMQLLRAQRFAAASLQQLHARATEQPGEALGRLERVLVFVEQRETGWIFAIGLFLGAGTQAAIALAGFRKRQGSTLRSQIEAWAEFEGAGGRSDLRRRARRDDLSGDDRDAGPICLRGRSVEASTATRTSGRRE